MNKKLMQGNCKNQTKAPKRSVEALKQAFDARLRGVLPAFMGHFEPKWVEFRRECNHSHQYSAQT
ncbi:hypothetical protein JQF37_10915 [Pseudomonas sp. MIL9]|uniref:hypothetical protein n=1 Tax=Pseudomonas sp. MIL9 TaxID=2807620 RepID=UPI001029D2FF|nr:hypothetical protein [Pseudomonas sp. MIL9]MBM6444128.1 hypothetical protein [Pseudomonas sp. MIL9]RZO07402.1 hypothetical protein EKG40_15380 [Pseudomonas moorei]